MSNRPIGQRIGGWLAWGLPFAIGLAATLVFVMVPVTASARTSSELLKAERHFAKVGKQNARLLSSSTTAVGRATAAGTTTGPCRRKARSCA